MDLPVHGESIKPSHNHTVVLINYNRLSTVCTLYSGMVATVFLFLLSTPSVSTGKAETLTVEVYRYGFLA